MRIGCGVQKASLVGWRTTPRYLGAGILAAWGGAQFLIDQGAIPNSTGTSDGPKRPDTSATLTTRMVLVVLRPAGSGGFGVGCECGGVGLLRAGTGRPGRGSKMVLVSGTNTTPRTTPAPRPGLRPVRRRARPVPLPLAHARGPRTRSRARMAPTGDLNETPP